MRNTGLIRISLVITMLFLSIRECSWAGQSLFTTSSSLYFGKPVKAVVDFNNDHLPDFLIDQQYPQASLSLQTGSIKPQFVSHALNLPYSAFQPVDFDKDGLIDFLYYDSWENLGDPTDLGREALIFAHNSGNDRFSTMTLTLCSSQVGSDYVSYTDISNVDVNDYNGDGLPDILVMFYNHGSLFGHDGQYDYSYNSFELFENIGNGKFSKINFPYESGDRYKTSVPVDLNRDGKLDVILKHDNLSYGTYYLIQYLADKHPMKYGNSVCLFSVDESWPQFPKICDCDNDGDMDAFMITPGNNLELWENSTGDLGHGMQRKVIETGGVIQDWITDFDGDKDIDILILKDNAYYLLERDNRIPAKYVKHLLFRPTTTNYNLLDPIDIDHDGDMDLLLKDGPALKIYINQGGNPPLLAGRTIPISNPNVQLLDVDGDNYLDLVVKTAKGLDWFRNRISDIFTCRLLSNGIQQPNSIWPIDLNKDGKMDVLSTAGSAGKIYWHCNQGGTVPTFNTIALPGTFKVPFGLYAADLDKDGDQDILYTAQSDKTIGWLENTGLNPPAFKCHVLTNAALEPNAVMATDLDRDGDYDIIAASAKDNTFWWFENNGAASPSFLTHKLSTTAKGACAVCVADLDKDGDQDVICASRADNTICWFRNSGGKPAVFYRNVITTTAMGVCSITTADMDRDGDQDILAASSNDNTVAWYENNGAWPPKFIRHPLNTKVLGVRSAMVADLDNDGDLDVVAASATDGAVIWFENDGKRPATFWRRRIDWPGSEVGFATTADLNRDGIPEVIGTLRQANTLRWYQNSSIAIKPRARVVTWNKYE